MWVSLYIYIFPVIAKDENVLSFEFPVVLPKNSVLVLIISLSILMVFSIQPLFPIVLPSLTISFSMVIQWHLPVDYPDGESLRGWVTKKDPKRWRLKFRVGLLWYFWGYIAMIYRNRNMIYSLGDSTKQSHILQKNDTKGFVAVMWPYSNVIWPPATSC